MDNRNYLLKHIYGEDDDPQRLADFLAQDEAHRREYEVLEGTRQLLDRRPRQRPDARVLDAVFLDAIEPAPARGRQLDRAARPSSRLPRLQASGVVSTLLVLFVVGSVGLGVLARYGSGGSSGAASTDAGKSAEAVVAEHRVPSAPLASEGVIAPHSEQPAFQAAYRASSLPPESLQVVADAMPAVMEESTADPFRFEPTVEVAPTADAAAADPAEVFSNTAPEADQSAPSEESAVRTRVALVWDESDEVRDVHRQVRFVEARSSASGWSEPAFSTSAEKAAGE